MALCPSAPLHLSSSAPRIRPPAGKKIDFLLQELLREVNTAGSKCREAGMGERVVAAKAALEKLREQCANLE